MKVPRPVTVAALLLALGCAAAAAPGADVQCQLAQPAACSLRGAADAAAGPPAKVVTDVAAATLAQCVEKARVAAAECLQAPGAAKDVSVRFRQGPVETVQSVDEPASAGKRSAPLRLPIVYGKDFETEAEQFQYRPRFAPGAVDFGLDGQLLVRSGSYLQVRARGGDWEFIDFARAATLAIERLPDVASFEWVLDTRFSSTDQRVHVDSLGRLYTLVQVGITRMRQTGKRLTRSYLLTSLDIGRSWAAAAVPMPDERSTWRSRIEHNDGNNSRAGPPPLLVYDRDENVARRSSALYLWIPRWEAGALSGPALLKIADDSLLQDNHSGAANSLVSTPDSIYIVYPGSRPVPDSPGTPAYLVVYDKAKGRASTPAAVGFGGSAAKVDNHNLPGICVGRNQALHVLLTGHQESLRMRSAVLDGSQLTWGPVETLGAVPTVAGGYTYGSLNCDRTGQIYVASRWSGDRYRFQLVLLKRDASGRWQGGLGGLAHQLLVDPGRAYYGAWRQRVAVDEMGVIYVTYAYYGNHFTESELHRFKWRFPFEAWERVKELVPRDCTGSGLRCWQHPMPEVTRAILTSSDGGSTWRFLE